VTDGSPEENDKATVPTLLYCAGLDGLFYDRPKENRERGRDAFLAEVVANQQRGQEIHLIADKVSGSLQFDIFIETQCQ
jgi:hypothetical protein